LKTSAKFLIDRAVATPMAWAANLGARAIAPIAKRDHSIDPQKIRTIAVSKLLGMGSIIQATPLLHDLKRSFPNARIVFMTTRSNKGLMDRLEVVDEVVYIDDSSTAKLALSTAGAVASLLRRKVELYFDLEVYSAGASVLSLVSGARNRCGLYRYSARFKKGIFTHLTVFNPRAPISAIYRQLHVAATGERFGDPVFGPLKVSPNDDESLRGALARNGLVLESRYVVVNPNASDLLLERRWPIERYVQLIEQLARRGEQIVTVGAKSETDYVQSLLARLTPEARSRVCDTAGKLSLGELFALIKSASCVVTNDTGPMHFSIALDRPTVCLFGPVSPEHYGVRKDNVEMLYHPVYCSPCAHELDEPPCAGNNVCMQLISVSEVLEAIDRRLSGKPRVHRLRLEQAYQDSRGTALGVILRASLEPGHRPPDTPPTPPTDERKRASHK
jgi:ADP-heptose:LPS heptosyltransferase